MAKNKEAAQNFETALSELKDIVSQMEKGQMTLETSLSAFVRGTTLVKQCQQQLQTAEQTIQLLTQQDNELSLQPYTVPDTESPSSGS